MATHVSTTGEEERETEMPALSQISQSRVLRHKRAHEVVEDLLKMQI